MSRKKYSTAPRARRSRVSPESIIGPVYVASPLTTYDTPRYDAMVSGARAHFPQATILPARDLFASNDDWRARWPDMLPTLAAVVVFAGDAGWIGAGVWAEVRDARKRGIPVYVLDDAGRLRRWESVRIIERRPDDWNRAARLDLPIPEPHAPARLAALASINPRQAAITAAVVERSGRPDCCAVCGDGPAPVYVLAEPPCLTARFCDDCIGIQRAMFGLNARPVAAGKGARDGS